MTDRSKTRTSNEAPAVAETEARDLSPRGARQISMGPIDALELASALPRSPRPITACEMRGWNAGYAHPKPPANANRSVMLWGMSS